MQKLEHSKKNKRKMTEKQLANLRPATKATAAVRGSLGGIKSGESKREKKTMRMVLEYLTSLQDSELQEHTELEAICLSMIRAAKMGSVRAAEFVRDTLGEKPTERDNNTITGNVIVQWQQNNEGVNPAGVVVDNGKQQVSLDVPASVPALAVNSNPEG